MSQPGAIREQVEGGLGEQQLPVRPSSTCWEAYPSSTMVGFTFPTSLLAFHPVQMQFGKVPIVCQPGLVHSDLPMTQCLYICLLFFH